MPNKKYIFVNAGSHIRLHQPAGHFRDRVLFEQLFESAPDGNILVDSTGKIILANRQAEKMFAYPHQKLTGQSINVLLPDSPRADSQQNPTPRPMADRQAELRTLTAVRKDGSVFPAEITLNPIRIDAIRADAGPLVLWVVRDITQRQERERLSVRQSELIHLMQDIAVAANEAMTMHSALQYVVNRLCSYLKWPLGHAFLTNENDEVTTSIWSNPSEKQYEVFKAVSEALRFRPGMGGPGIVLTTGQPAWFNNLPENPNFLRAAEARGAGLKTSLALPIIAGKHVAGVLEFFTPADVPTDPNLLAVFPHAGMQVGRVVERTTTEETLRKQAAQLRMIMTNMPVILWQMDREGRLLLLEGKGVLSTGLRSEELVGKNIIERFSTRPDVQELIRRALHGEEIHTEVASGKGATFELFLTPYYNEHHQVDGIISLSFDITDRKQLEAELEEMKARLLDSSDAERARLAQQLHDGPLQDLYGAYYQLQELKPALDPANEEVVGRALQTIQGVNATLRVICGELHPNTLVHLGLQRAIRGHAERTQERLEGVRIVLDLAEDSPASGSVLSNNQRLGLFRVYQQLISNAVRHSGAKHIWVRLDLTPARVALEVQDDGRGFQPPAHWVELVRQGRYGLVSANERVRGLDGRMEIRSHPDGGTIVRVTVPVQAQG